MERRLDTSEKNSLAESMDMALDLFSRGIDAFFSGELEDSHRIIGMTAPLEERCAGMEAMAQHHKGEIATALVAVIGSIRRIGGVHRGYLREHHQPPCGRRDVWGTPRRREHERERRPPGYQMNGPAFAGPSSISP